MLTQFEKWFFDLRGYFVLKNAVTKKDIKEMVKLAEKWYNSEPEQLPEPMFSNFESPAAKYLYNFHYAEKIYERLVLNKEILRFVNGIQKNNTRVYDILLAKTNTQNKETVLHSGFEGGFQNPNEQFVTANNEIFASFVNVGVSLVDVPDHLGFTCLPGTHKGNFKIPEGISLYDDPPTVVNVPVNAGDVIIFTPILRHGARAWTEKYPRYTVFMRYIYAKQFHSNESDRWPPYEKYKNNISDELYELESRDHGQRKILYKYLEKYGMVPKGSN